MSTQDHGHDHDQTRLRNQVSFLEAEVTELTGRTLDGRLETVRVAAEGSPAANPAFDVTPARLVTGLITERGVCEASAEGLAALFPEKHNAGNAPR